MDTIQTVNCPSCGAPLTIPESVDNFKCSFCGETLTVQRSEGHATTKLAEKVDQAVQEVPAAVQAPVVAQAPISKPQQVAVAKIKVPRPLVGVAIFAILLCLCLPIGAIVLGGKSTATPTPIPSISVTITEETSTPTETVLPYLLPLNVPPPPSETPSLTWTAVPPTDTLPPKTATFSARATRTALAGITLTQARQASQTVRAATLVAYTPPPPTAAPVVVVPTLEPTAAPIPTQAPVPTSVPAQIFRVGAMCADGSSSSATGSGACSHHGGVSCWKMSDGTCVPK